MAQAEAEGRGPCLRRSRRSTESGGTALGEGRGKVAGSLVTEGDLVRTLGRPRVWTDLIELVF